MPDKKKKIDWKAAVINPRNQVIKCDFKDKDDITAQAQAVEYARNLTTRCRAGNRDVFRAVTPAYFEADLPEEKEPEEPAKPDYEAQTVKELRELCKERGIEVPRGAKEIDIIALLEGDDASKG